MHAYILLRGIKRDVDEFILELQGMYTPYKYPDENKILQPKVLQTSVRPIQLFEIVFPEEHKDIMLATLFPDGKGGQTQHKHHNKFIFALRKILGVEKIPEYKNNLQMPIYRQNCEIIGIGVKKDYWINAKTGKRIDNPTEEQKKECYEGI